MNCTKCGRPLGTAPTHGEGGRQLCQACALEDAVFDAELADLAQPASDQPLDGFFKGGRGLKGLALGYLLGSATNRKIGMLGCLGLVILVGITAFIVDLFSGR